MGKEPIIAKIRQTLAGMPMSEPVVVYVLVEIRKFYDHYRAAIPDRKERFPFPTLRLCCDWVAHVELDRDDAREILIHAAEYVEATKRSPEERGDQGYFFSRIRFESLRLELAEFQRANAMPVFDDAQWNDFLTQFVLAIQDCPLKLKGGDDLCVDEGLVVAAGSQGRCAGEAPPVVFVFRKKGRVVLQTAANSMRKGDTDRVPARFGPGL